ncbi:basic helix-loop-helix (bHLH) DNA-bindingsuperfamily protein [Striga asiatica]|uniref:Basic helix-loop-helix (BHLH) DNA-bindingsuperfamily protein n=1 Tax=Striga asiatica TaxID=4170 RepID=A0A5A7P7Q7_STRAF|nr:basic helix-loop-helix (bHLH) DNA-bindingsuperfamily protein [Striga asiatica]
MMTFLLRILKFSVVSNVPSYTWHHVSSFVSTCANRTIKKKKGKKLNTLVFLFHLIKKKKQKMGENCISVVNAIEQMQDLDQRLKKLEEKQTNEASSKEDELPDEKCGVDQIQARVNRTNVLLKLQCRKRKGVLVKLLMELDKLNLDVVSASIVPFGSFVLDITITAEVVKEFSGSAEDVVTTIRNCLHSDA